MAVTIAVTHFPCLQKDGQVMLASWLG